MRRILACDDEPDIRYIYETVFDHTKVEVTACGNGKEASRMIAREKFDIIITDLKMPWVDGAELYSRIRKSKDHSDTPVVFVTGYSGELSSDILIDENVTVFEKPCDPASLVEHVNKTIAEIEVREANKPKPKVDIHLIDNFQRAITSVFERVSGMEGVDCMRPYVYRQSEKIELDMYEHFVFETQQIEGEIALMFRKEVYLWLTSVMGSYNYKTIEKRKRYCELEVLLRHKKACPAG